MSYSSNTRPYAPIVESFAVLCVTRVIYRAAMSQHSGFHDELFEIDGCRGQPSTEQIAAKDSET